MQGTRKEKYNSSSDFGSLEEELENIICVKGDLPAALAFYNKHHTQLDVSYQSPSPTFHSFLYVVYGYVVCGAKFDYHSRRKGLELFRKLLSRRDYTRDVFSAHDLAYMITPTFAKSDWVKLSMEAAIMLYRDERFDVNKTNNKENTIMDSLTILLTDNIRQLKALFSSCRPLEYNKIQYSKIHLNCLGRFDKNVLVSQYTSNRKRTAHWCRLDFRLPEANAASTFALVVYLCDGYLKLKCDANSKERRFINIASRLPMDLQMTLCNRAYGLSKDSILKQDSEPAFAFYGSILHLSNDRLHLDKLARKIKATKRGYNTVAIAQIREILTRRLKGFLDCGPCVDGKIFVEIVDGYWPEHDIKCIESLGKEHWVISDSFPTLHPIQPPTDCFLTFLNSPMGQQGVAFHDDGALIIRR